MKIQPQVMMMTMMMMMLMTMMMYVIVCFSKNFTTLTEAKAMAEKAQKDALEMAQSKCVLQ